MDKIICQENITQDNQTTNEKNMLHEARRDVIKWIKNHKRILVLSGMGAATLIGVILCLNNKESLEAFLKSIKESIYQKPMESTSILTETARSYPAIEHVVPKRTYQYSTESFDIKSHIRNMAPGMKHSVEKAAEAAALGIDLLPNQTLVDSYTKFVA